MMETHGRVTFSFPYFHSPDSSPSALFFSLSFMIFPLPSLSYLPSPLYFSFALPCLLFLPIFFDSHFSYFVPFSKPFSAFFPLLLSFSTLAFPLLFSHCGLFSSFTPSSNNLFFFLLPSFPTYLPSLHFHLFLLHLFIFSLLSTLLSQNFAFSFLSPSLSSSPLLLFPLALCPDFLPLLSFFHLSTIFFLYISFPLFCI